MDTTALIIIGTAAAFLAVAMLFPRRKLFLRNRRPLTDSEYTTQTETPPHLREHVLALRHAMGEVCGIDEKYIHPDDAMSRLSSLPFDWDPVGIILFLEERFARALPDGHTFELAEKMPFRKKETFHDWNLRIVPFVKDEFKESVQNETHL